MRKREMVAATLRRFRAHGAHEEARTYLDAARIGYPDLDSPAQRELETAQRAQQKAFALQSKVDAADHIMSFRGETYGAIGKIVGTAHGPENRVEIFRVRDGRTMRVYYECASTAYVFRFWADEVRAL